MTAAANQNASCKAGDWLSGLEFFGIRLGLEQTQELFRLAGQPDAKLKFIHVAGSNGKGSVCALLDAALRRVGFKTGFYSSPHLCDVRERFRVDGRCPDEKAFASLSRRAKEIVEQAVAHGSRPTYFEVTTLMAAMHFAEENVDFVLWETGMGGRLDSTNVVNPLCSIISSLSLEHSDRLGDTLAKIAFEKAGIVKPGAPVFCARIPGEALKVVRERAAQLGSPFLTPPAGAEEAEAKTELAPDGRILQAFRLEGRDFKLSLPGPRQRANAALCLEVLEWLAPRFKFGLESSLKGFSCVRWPARLQILPAKRTIVDGAHNPEAAQALAGTLAEAFPGEKFQIVLGSFKDKDGDAVTRSLAPLASEFVFVPVGSDRPSWTPEELSRMLEKSGCAGTPHRSASLEEALSTPPPEGRRRLLCGSLHLCGEALEILGERESVLNL